jgi:hypothetical protein
VNNISDTTAIAVAGHGLAQSQLVFPDVPLNAQDWAQLVSAVRRHGVGGLLTAAIVDGVLPASPDQLEEAGRIHRHEMQVAVLVERVLLDAIVHLGDAGIDYRAMKGVAMCRLAYGRPELRAFRDADLLVPSDQYDAAVAALVNAGYRRETPELRRGFDRRFAKGTAMISPAGFEIDLHRMFTEGRFGLTTRPTECFEGSAPFDVGGTQVQALTPGMLFISGCFSAAIGDQEPRLNSLRDIAQLLANASIDVDAVLRVTHRWRIGAVVARAITLTVSTFALPCESELIAWAQAYVPDAKEQRALLAHTGAHRSWTAQAYLALEAIPGLRDKLAYARAVLRPDREHLKSRGIRHRDRYRNAVRIVRQTIRP